MKKIILICLGVILFFNVTLLNSQDFRPVMTQEKQMEKIAFATYANDVEQLKSLEVLIKSIRNYGGTAKEAPIFLAVNENLKKQLPDFTKYKVKYFLFTNSMPSVPYSFKAVAAAALETQCANTFENMIWLDPETILLNQPNELYLSDGKTIGLRPVFLKNEVGIAYNKEFNSYWKDIFSTAKIIPNKDLFVETIVDDQKIYPYYNCGVFSVNPAKSICQKWLELQNKIFGDNKFLSQLKGNQMQQIFLHQVVFTVSVQALTNPNELQDLSVISGYPIHLHDQLKSNLKAESLDKVQIVILENTLAKNPDILLSKINDSKVKETVKAWLKHK